MVSARACVCVGRTVVLVPFHRPRMPPSRTISAAVAIMPGGALPAFACMRAFKRSKGSEIVYEVKVKQGRRDGSETREGPRQGRGKRPPSEDQKGLRWRSRCRR
jgi:hypothetical protein